MDLDLIEMPVAEARKRFIEYRDAVRARHNEEDAEIMRGYRAMANGSQLLVVSNALKQGGLDEHGRPRLAIMRADRPWCWFKRDSRSGNVEFSADERVGWTRRRPNVSRYPDYLQFRSVFPIPATASHSDGIWSFRHRALVPSIPPSLRPSGSLANYHLLWEPSWEEIPPPPDPVLLKRISHDLYAVLAVWDLTEIELAVLGRRFAK